MSKQNMNTLKLYTILALLFLFTACKKNKNQEDGQDTDPVVTISMTSPSQSSVTLMQGDTLNIAGTIVATEEIHGYTLLLRSPVTGTEYLNKADGDHTKNYAIDESFVNNLPAHEDLLLTITVQINHDGDLEKRSYEIHCMP